MFFYLQTTIKGSNQRKGTLVVVIVEKPGLLFHEKSSQLSSTLCVDFLFTSSKKNIWQCLGYKYSITKCYFCQKELANLNTSVRKVRCNHKTMLSTDGKSEIQLSSSNGVSYLKCTLSLCSRRYVSANISKTTALLPSLEKISQVLIIAIGRDQRVVASSYLQTKS